MAYADGSYWRQRADLLYYQYFRYLVRCIGAEATSLIDVGSGNAAYLEWFDWIPEKVSVDIRVPYQSGTVRGIQGDILSLEFPKPFDLCTCMQVLEHVSEPQPFARRLLELGEQVLVSVPHKWPAGATKGHLNDPVDLEIVIQWFGRRPNYRQIVAEPFTDRKGERLFAIFDVRRPNRRYGRADREGRRPG